MILLLTAHPLMQFTATCIGLYAAWLGLQRAKAIHYANKTSVFKRKRHAVTGGIALLTFMAGFFGGHIMVSLFMENHKGIELHETFANATIPFLIIGLTSGFYLYRKPRSSKRLALLHAINNMVVLGLAFLQFFTGTVFYLSHIVN